MELIIYNPTSCNTVRTLPKKPFLRISKNGYSVSLNAYLTQFLKLKDGSRIEFARDEKSPEEWYLRVLANGETNGFLCRQKDEKVQSATVSCRPVITLLLASLTFKPKTPLNFLISEKPVEVKAKNGGVLHWYPIITASAKPNYYEQAR